MLPDGAVLIFFKPLENTPANAHFLPDIKERADLWGGILLRESEIEVEEVVEDQPVGPAANSAKAPRGSISRATLADLFNGKPEISLPGNDINPLARNSEGPGESRRRSGNAMAGFASTYTMQTPLPRKGSSMFMKSPDPLLMTARKKLIKVKKKVISTSVIVKGNLHLEFIPDWM